MSISYTSCTLCPRMCRIDRRTSRGYCQADNTIKIARAALHPWEEPCISGTNGSGTVFFSEIVMAEGVILAEYAF